MTVVDNKNALVVFNFHKIMIKLRKQYKLPVRLGSPELFFCYWLFYNLWNFLKSIFHGKRLVVCLNRAVFNIEINQLGTLASDVIFSNLSSRILKSIFVRYLGSVKVNGLTDDNYNSHIVNFPQSRDELYEFWYKYLWLSKKLGLIDGILTTSFKYALQMEFNRACVDLDIPFIVVFRESVMTEHQYCHYISKYYGDASFLGTHLIFYTPFARDVMLEEIKDRSVSKYLQRVPIIGFTRSDLLVSERRITCDLTDTGNDITLFSMAPGDGMRYVFPKEIWADGDLLNQVEKFYLMFVRVAMSMPMRQFNIKSKLPSFRGHIENLLTQNGIEKPPNLKIIYGGDPKDLLFGSTVVCGFSTTVLLEGLALNKIIVEPRIFSDTDTEKYTLLGPFPEARNLITSENELKLIIESPKEFEPTEESRKEALEKYFYKIDGRGTERLYTEVLAAVT